MATNTDRGVKSREYDYTTRKAYYNSMIMSQKEINLRHVGEFRRATVQITARISAEPGNVCDDRRVTTPRCIVNEDSGMRNFVKTNRGTQKTMLHCQRIQRNCPLEVTGQMASPRARRRPTVTLGVLYSYRMPGFIQGWPQNYIASLWTQYSFGSRW